MRQLQLEVPDEVAEEVRGRAESEGVTVSDYLAKLVCREVVTEWPEGYFEEVLGGWVGNPLERPPQGDFETRDPL